MQIGIHKLSSKRPSIMGILNVTPDSFSDGGLFLDKKAAVDRALKLEIEGADILDLGGESSRPNSSSISVQEEVDRVIPVIEEIRRHSKILISIDTTKSQVASLALAVGADMINDISAGTFDAQMFGVAAKANCPICLMHMRGTPATMQADTSYENLVSDISGFLAEAAKRANASGIASKNIILDPGICFGKSAEDNVLILKSLPFFKELGFPLLVGASRKSFIGKLLDLEVKERLEATLATIPICVESKVDIIRVHDVESTKRFLDMYELLA